MNVKPTPKICDKCKQNRKTKRYAIHRQWPYYFYVGFDLCVDCEDKFEDAMIEFMEGFLEPSDGCVICRGEITGYPNNADPLAKGKCCDKCNIEVLKERKKISAGVNSSPELGEI